MENYTSPTYLQRCAIPGTGVDSYYIWKEYSSCRKAYPKIDIHCVQCPGVPELELVCTSQCRVTVGGGVVCVNAVEVSIILRS